MHKPLDITYRGMGSSEAVEARIRQKAAKLEQLFADIVSCHVTVEAPPRHKQQGGPFKVRVQLHVPGKDLVADRSPDEHRAHEDVYVAIRDAFDAAGRQLEDYIRKRRGKVKHHDVPPHGVVARIFADDGYGFVRRSDGLEIYFHENSVADGAFADLAAGDEVRVVVAEGQGERGPQASSVVPVGKHHVVEGAPER